MKNVMFVVKIGYKSFEFTTIEEATLFAVTAKKTSTEDEDVCIKIDWAVETETTETEVE